MRDIEFYVTKNTKILYGMIKNELKEGPFQIAVDCRIRNEKDLEKASVHHAIRRRAKSMAASEYKQAQKPAMKMLVPREDGRIAGQEIKKGVPLPCMVPDVVEDHEITVEMIATGIIEYLSDGCTENAEYLAHLLVSIYPHILDVDFIDTIIPLDAKYHKVFLDVVQVHKPENFEVWEKKINEADKQQGNGEHDQLSGVHSSEDESGVQGMSEADREGRESGTGKAEDINESELKEVSE
jgi:hypothetical protein